VIVYTLTEGVVVEGLENIGIYSTLEKAKDRLAQRRKSISFADDVEWFIEEHEVDSDRGFPVRTYKMWADGSWSA
jgi:hypothetical protein